MNLHLRRFTFRDGLRRRDIFARRLLRIPKHACDPNQYQNAKCFRHRFLLLMTSKKGAKYLPATSTKTPCFPMPASKVASYFQQHELTGLSGMSLRSSDHVSCGLT